MRALKRMQMNGTTWHMKGIILLFLSVTLVYVALILFFGVYPVATFTAAWCEGEQLYTSECSIAEWVLLSRAIVQSDILVMPHVHYA
jgi:hypothetical protein